MFHTESLMTSESLVKVWKSANGIDIESDNECDLPEICRNIDSWISTDAFEIHRRLSLRTSSTLINGATRLYKSGLEQLLKDLKTLDETMIRCKRGFTHIPSESELNNSSGSELNNSSESPRSPEQMRREVERNLFEISTSPNKRAKMGSTSASDVTINLVNRPTRSMAEEESSSSSVTRLGQSSRNHSSICLENHRISSVSNDNGRRDQNVQTSPNIQQPVGDDDGQDGFDVNLPFAYLLIHDNYRSRVPSKIILSNVTSDVRNLN